jgi:2-keto-4-pentenoate hydratase/2-oxohepta-3-ene-1,7-dioic acid hydratase in catechol pathway
VKLLSFAYRGRPSYGAFVAGGVVELGHRLGREYPGVRDLLEREGLRAAAKIAASNPPDHSLDEIAFLPPVPAPEKIICVGVNYRDRNEEYGDGSERPRYPSIFMRAPDSLVGHRAPLLRPPESAQLDYEGEIAVVIGKRGRRIPPSAALQHVAGLTCMNEGTLRDWLRHAKFNVTPGKNFDGSGSIGPWMATTDEFDGFGGIRVATRVNGEVRQDDTTANMLFSIPDLIGYISTFTTLKPGDVIATGTPTGAGARLDPPRFLVPGDVVEVEVAGVGVLVNTVADEKIKADS